ncbi:aldehyde dehydrogenase [bacterium]|nr:aldehyde dehydrogenase [bacterium]
METIASIPDLIRGHREFFASGATRDIEWRKSQLRTLKAVIKSKEARISEALRADLGKSDFEAFTSEIGFLYEEINVAVRELDDWAAPRHVPTPIFIAPARSYVRHEPLGVVLVIAPWNYPFHLAIAPLVAAIAAGNCAVVKPSELAVRTSDIVAEVIRDAFMPGFVSAVTGGVEISTALLKERFDHIFFTGGTAIGRVVMRAAAEHLTPVTLELGGKSPCIVDASTDLKVAARRIVWGKFFNAGQTCVAPDYLLVENRAVQTLVRHMRTAIRDFFGDDPSKSPDYGRIINHRHFERLEGYLTDAQILLGGDRNKDSLYFAPTLLDAPSNDSLVMQDEIFGPLLPVKTWTRPEEAKAEIESRSRPLAFYCFTRDEDVRDYFIDGISFGGGCVNNTLVHLANPSLPFGGVGDSGMGRYHGRDGFLTFSHQKAIVDSALRPDIPLKYPPYKGRLKWLKALIR